MNKLIRPAKSALAQKFGYKNVSVKNGSGTAWGWVEARVETKKPADCMGDNPSYCKSCRETIRRINKEAFEAMYTAWRKLNLKPYTFYSDDGYNTQHDDVLVDVQFV